MSKFKTSRVEPNEVVKAIDINNGLDSQIQNIKTLVKCIIESDKDFVINGTVENYNGGGMNIAINPIFGICESTGVPVINTEKTAPIGIGASWNVDRIDIVEVQGNIENISPEQRAFIDFNTKEKTLLDVFTEQQLELKVNVKHNTNTGSFIDQAPEVSEGWIKLAEIFVPANSVDIDECEIRNITADDVGMENSDWTYQKDSTYNLGSLGNLKSQFKTEHNTDGTHKNKVIHSNNIDTGTGTKQVNASIFPINKKLDFGTNHLTILDNVAEVTEKIAIMLETIYQAYLKYEKYNFKGELEVSDKSNADDNALVDSLKIGTDTDEDDKRFAYIKIKDATMFKFYEDKIILGDDYISFDETDKGRKIVSVNNKYAKNGNVTLGMEEFTYIVDSDAALARWFNNTEGYDYTSVLIKKGTWSIDLDNDKIDTFHQTDTKFIKGEPESKLNLLVTLSSSDAKYLKSVFLTTDQRIDIDQVLYSEEIILDYKIENIELDVVLNGDYFPAVISGYSCSNCRINFKKINAYGEASGYYKAVAGFFGCVNLDNCVVKYDFASYDSLTTMEISMLKSDQWEYAFVRCKNLSNCYSFNIGGFQDCYNLTNCCANFYFKETPYSIYKNGFLLCFGLSSCKVKAYAYPSDDNNNLYFGIKGFVNCHEISSSQADIQSGGINGTGVSFKATDKNISYGFNGCSTVSSCNAQVTLYTTDSSKDTGGAICFSSCRYIGNCTAYFNSYMAKLSATNIQGFNNIIGISGCYASGSGGYCYRKCTGTVGNRAYSITNSGYTFNLCIPTFLASGEPTSNSVSNTPTGGFNLGTSDS